MTGVVVSAGMLAQHTGVARQTQNFELLKLDRIAGTICNARLSRRQSWHAEKFAWGACEPCAAEGAVFARSRRDRNVMQSPREILGDDSCSGRRRTQLERGGVGLV